MFHGNVMGLPVLPTFNSAGDLSPTNSPSCWEFGHVQIGHCKSRPESGSTNTRGEVVILLTGSDYQIHVYG